LSLSFWQKSSLEFKKEFFAKINLKPIVMGVTSKSLFRFLRNFFWKNENGAKLALTLKNLSLILLLAGDFF
jgi:hypothetical protein